jgi:hypothetical protein
MAKKDKTKYQLLVEAHKDTLILQNESLFYNAYNESACVLADLTDYQLINLPSGKLRCSCLSDKINDIVQILDDAHISYIVSKKEKILYQNKFEDNKFRMYADSPHTPDSIRTASGSIEMIKALKISKEELKRYNNAVIYTQRMCDGLDPCTGKPSDTVSLNEPNVLRYLFYIQEFLKSHSPEV